MGERSEETTDNRKGRVLVLSMIVAAGFLAYVSFLFSLQIVKGVEYQDRARRVSLRMVSIPSQRGEIYDRNGDVPLVINVDSYAVDIIPAEVPKGQMESLKRELSALLSIPMEAIQRKLPPQMYHLHRAVEIADRVPVEKIFFLAEHIDEYPGVTWHNKPIRNYLETGSIAHVIGYVSEITTGELRILYNQGYKSGDLIGKSGIEKQYDQLLRGEEGARYKTVDVWDRRVDAGSESIIEPVLGKDIVLTIDRKIQKLCEEALGARVGSVVVLKPATGEILAMVSYPWYNANIFSTERVGGEFNRLALDPLFPFLNRAIQSSYHPASTFKILMTTALIEEKAVDPKMEVECTGSHILGDREFRCWLEHGHGFVSLKEGLAESCNVYFQTVGLEHLGIDVIANYMHRFGLGAHSGIDLPGEKRGIAPSPGWKESTTNQKWVGGDTFNTSIGQGFTETTPLQMANMVAMIVNAGAVYQPRILKEIRDPVSGEVIEKVEPTLLRTSTISEDTFLQVQELMRGAVADGTASAVINTKAVEIAGKTGTGQVGLEGRWDSWFVAFGPYGAAPEEAVVVVVLVEAVNEWEWWAPKAANLIFQGIFADQTFAEVVETLRPWYVPRR